MLEVTLAYQELTGIGGNLLELSGALPNGIHAVLRRLGYEIPTA